ncbi:MAG: nucleotidyl transferase AbiEii/AbiGii toxin family protein [Candidatus Micrarchaeaceae archaeon]
MQYDIDTERLSMTIGIGKDRLDKDIETYVSMGKIFPFLEGKGLKVGLFGGTALNKIYFGKAQRLSYDLDIFCYSNKRTVEALKETGAKEKYTGMMPANRAAVSTRMTYGSIVLDLVDAAGKYLPEEPKTLQAVSLLYYYRALVLPFNVPSYSLELLLAEKTFAMTERNELRDIYDVWTGMGIMKDKKLYLKYIKGSARRNGINDAIGYIDLGITLMLENVEYYGKRRIETTNARGAGAMLKDIKAFIDTL